MLTTLNIQQVRYNTRFSRFIGRLKKDKIEVSYRQLGSIKVKCVDYTQNSQRVNWDKLDKIIRAQRNRLLCKKYLCLPASIGYKRYDDNEYKIRLCTNLGVKLVALCDNNISVGIIDLKAEHTALVAHVLRYTDSVTVVTDRDDIYKDVADNILEESGAPIRISKSQKSIYNCELIFDLSASVNISSLRADALVLGIKEYESESNCTVIFDYKATLEKPFDSLCPPYLDETYFASALYSLHNVYQLGALIPHTCVCANVEYSTETLAEKLNNMGAKP